MDGIVAGCSNGGVSAYGVCSPPGIAKGNAVAEFGGNSAEMAIEFLACQHCKTNGSAEFGQEASLTRSKIHFMQICGEQNCADSSNVKSAKRNSLLSAVMSVRSSGGRHH